MSEKPKKKKVVIKKVRKGGTIADKIEKERREKVAKKKESIEREAARPAEKKPEVDKPKTFEPRQRPEATVSASNKPPEKPLPDKAPPRTVFIDPQEQAKREQGRKKNKKKSNLREDILRQEEHKKFFLKQQNQQKKQSQTPQQQSSIPDEIKITEYIQVGELARKLNVKTPDIIAKLMKMGVMATITQSIDADTASLVASEYGTDAKVVSLYDETVITEKPDEESELINVPPVVTVMGHVDHGKTKLLDALRKTDIVATEAGGITQHIGAYQISRPKGRITFLDTPGHEAFTAMRARGAQITNIVVLVVAADDGIMPQTAEAINHAKDADVPIIVAINKIDKPDANPERIRQELSQHDLLPEDWGGTTPVIEISALKGTNIDKLEDMILAQAEIMEIRANPDKIATGTVIEAKLDQGRGAVATILVSNGTLKQGDAFVVGLEGGRVRAMLNDRGEKVKEAGPATPVEILGLTGVPNAGDPFHVMESEKEAKDIVEKRQELNRQQQAQTIKKVKLENLNQVIEEGKLTEFKVIIKGDVQGSVEAMKASLEKLSNQEVRVTVILGNTGEISESDVMLASAANAMIVGFNTRANAKVREVADKEGVEIRYYNIIYTAIDDIKNAIAGMLSPDVSEELTGEIELRDTFKISAIGTVGGGYVTSGYIRRNNPVRVIRDGVVIYEGKIKSLKRFKDDVNEVKEGYECGILIEQFNDIKVGDTIEGYEIKETARSYDDIGAKQSGGGSEKATELNE